MAIDRTSKLAFVRLEATANVHTASDFLAALIEAVPYKIHTVLTDNGVQLCDAPHNRSGPPARWRLHRFDRTCREHRIEHRLTKPDHPLGDLMIAVLFEARIDSLTVDGPTAKSSG